MPPRQGFGVPCFSGGHPDPRRRLAREASYDLDVAVWECDFHFEGERSVTDDPVIWHMRLPLFATGGVLVPLRRLLPERSAVDGFEKLRLIDAERKLTYRGCVFP
jgi:hypothetical protein